MLLLSCKFLALLSVVLANPVARRMVVHNARESVPSGFVNNGPAPAEQTLELKIALVSSDMAGLEKELYAVSDPKSARYGKHLSKEQVESYVAPTAETTSKVTAWLKENNVTPKTASPAGDWVKISLPVSKANSLFATTFDKFTHKESNTQSIRTLGYSIPSDLKGHIDLVYPTTTFPVTVHGGPKFQTPLPARNVTARVDSSCASQVTPSCLQQLYGIPSSKGTQSSNVIGVAGLINQYAQQADLSQFLSMLRPDLDSSTSFTLETLDGGSNPQDPSQAGVEANLDVQYTVGVASGVPTAFISCGDNQSSDGCFLDISNFLLAQDTPPTVLTTSYGLGEDDIGSDVANNICNGFMQLGARGVSVLFASGDGGVSGVQSQSCTTFVPTFPASCPYVTAVGGTTGIGPETAASFSGGGFSNIFSTPSYQSSAVSSYVSGLGSTYSGLYNPNGRGFPDVAAQGVNVEIVNGGSAILVGGTSCSSPIFASVVGLINDRLIAAGKSTLGFLNPWVYSTAASALNDVTSGNNPGCNTNGFSAGTGWDPVTGLGTPNFDALVSAAGL